MDDRSAIRFVGRLTSENPIKVYEIPTEEERYRPEYQKPVKYFCKLNGCGRPFIHKSALIQHERTHLGIKPFLCKFDGCTFSSIKRNIVRRHIRQKHFRFDSNISKVYSLDTKMYFDSKRLPKTYKKQQSLNIVDERDPDSYIEEDIEKLSLF